MFHVDNRAGWIVRVETWYGVTHYGIWTGSFRNGEPTVVTSGPLTGIVEQTLSEFAEGQDVEWHGFPGMLPGVEVVRRARAEIGRVWLLWDNCEHFVCRAHRIPEDSPQLRRALGHVAAVGAVVAVVAAAKKA